MRPLASRLSDVAPWNIFSPLLPTSTHFREEASAGQGEKSGIFSVQTMTYSRFCDEYPKSFTNEINGDS
jgi:hypothetical protein